MGEQRYKVGDWVRVKDNRGASLDYKVGDVGQVSSIRGDLIFFKGKPGMFDYRFEPWQPRVGERVKVKESANFMWVGEGSVHEVRGSVIILKMKTGKNSGVRGGFFMNDLEPILSTATPDQPATLKIEAGKFYKTRDGRKVGPMVEWVSGQFREKIGDGRFWLSGGKGRCAAADEDIIAEWIDEPVAKPITTTANNDNAQPKFKVGDRVRFVQTYGLPRVRGKIAEVVSTSGWGIQISLPGEGLSTESPDSLELVAAQPTTTTIVALIENGQPKPSSTPHVHATTGAAEREAKRLAAKFKGQQFGVFTLTTTHEEAAPVYDHKWQNLAALGLKIDAIKELRSITGMGLKPAKDAVEYFLDAA